MARLARLNLRRIAVAVLVAAIVWALAHALDLLIGITPAYGRWVGAAVAFVATLFLGRRET